ncbi:hypothetical protein GCM10028786_29210 [Flaviaesturariibacter terrae]
MPRFVRLPIDAALSVEAPPSLFCRNRTRRTVEAFGQPAEKAPGRNAGGVSIKQNPGLLVVAEVLHLLAQAFGHGWIVVKGLRIGADAVAVFLL